MIQEFRAEPIQLLQVHHLKVQVHRLLEVNQLKSNQVIDSNYFYNPNYTIKSVKNQISEYRKSRRGKKRLLSYLEQATGIEPASQAWEACILTIVLCLQKGNTKIYCLRAKPVHHGLCSFLYFFIVSHLLKRQDVNPTQAPRVLLKTSSNSQSPLPVIYCVISIPAEKARDMRKTFLNFVIPQRYGSRTPKGINIAMFPKICTSQKSRRYLMLMFSKRFRTSQKGISSAWRSPHCRSMSVSQRTAKMYTANSAVSIFLFLLHR